MSSTRFPLSATLMELLFLSYRHLTCLGFVSMNVLTSVARCWNALMIWATCLTTGTSMKFTLPKCRMVPGSSTSFPSTVDVSTCLREGNTVASQSGQPWTPMWGHSAAFRTFRLSLLDYVLHNCEWSLIKKACAHYACFSMVCFW